jgi:hypothetical protein
LLAARLFHLLFHFAFDRTIVQAFDPINAARPTRRAKSPFLVRSANMCSNEKYLNVR